MSRVRDLADNNIVFVDGISTLDITENNNLFFTNARADARIAAATTTDLTEGTNLYFTNARADARAQIKVDAIVGAAPGTLDTLQELGDALGDDPNFATTVTNSIATKLPLAGGTLTGNVEFGTSNRAKFGTSNQLEIYAGSGDAHIKESGSANFVISGNNMYLTNTDQTKRYFLGSGSTGKVTLYYGSSEKLKTTSTGIDVTGSLSAESISVNTGTPVSSSPSAHFRRNHGAQAYQQLSGLALYWNTSNGLQDNTIVYGASTNSSLKFTHADGTTFNDRLIISSSGNVGIGTTSPEETLSVMGDFQVALNTSVTGRGLKVSTSNTSITDDTVTMNAQAATGILAFQTNSLERMRITSGGDVSIGSDHSGFSGWRVLNMRQISTGALINFEEDDGTRASTLAAWGSALRYQTHIAGGYHKFETDASTNAFQINDNGHVVVNTHQFPSNPTGSKLNVFGNGEVLRLDGTGNTSRTLRFRGCGTDGSANAIIESDGILQIKNEDANAHIYLNSVRDIAMQTTSGNGTAGHFTFSSYNTEIMRIDGANNYVGIGTSSPSNQLHLQKSADNGVVIENTTGATLSLLATGAGRVRSSGHLIFDTGGSTEHMRIESSGNVGIGTASPQEMIHAFNPSTSAAIRVSGEGNNNKKAEIGYHASDGPYVKGGSSGITSLKFYVDNTSLALTLASNRNATFAQSVTATSFYGDGSALTGISAGPTLSSYTPTFAWTGTGAIPSGSVWWAIGKYFQLGNLTWFGINAAFFGHSASGELYITTPTTIPSISGSMYPGSFRYSGTLAGNFGSNGFERKSSSTVYPYVQKASGYDGRYAYADTENNGGFRIQMSGWYWS